MILVCVALEAELPEFRLNGYTVLYTGVGKVQAAAKLAYELGSPSRHPRYTEVWNYGTAGGLNPLVAGLVEIGTFVQRDMCAEPQAPRGTIPFSDPVVGDLKTHAPIMQVRCGTGDSFVMAPDPWFVKADVDCVDMEGWALAYVCKQHHIKFRSWKYISDMADEDAAESWAKNVQDGAEIFTEKVRNGV
tara:strand:+ start:25370 stop:25936 length:567 start_codon:yes stop_codon:yes gene_type:complete